MLEILRKKPISISWGSAAGPFFFPVSWWYWELWRSFRLPEGRRTSALIRGRDAVQLKFDQAIRVDEARKALEANGLADAELQEFGSREQNS